VPAADPVQQAQGVVFAVQFAFATATQVPVAALQVGAVPPVVLMTPPPDVASDVAVIPTAAIVPPMARDAAVKAFTFMRFALTSLKPSRR
jgi:hypothetical protein